jgi:hypothetical protein
VGDEGLTTVQAPSEGQAGYTRIREALLTLKPTPSGQPTSVGFNHPTMTQHLMEVLVDDESTFDATLYRFAETAPSYIERFETDPLDRAVEYLQSTPLNSQLTIILTTDHTRSQLQHIIEKAASNNTTVLVFIAPTVLFDTISITDLEAAYQRYRSFEEFRSGLERNNRIVAYEVGPSERLASLLASQQPQTTARQTTSRGAR